MPINMFAGMTGARVAHIEFWKDARKFYGLTSDGQLHEHPPISNFPKPFTWDSLDSRTFLLSGKCPDPKLPE